MRHLIDPLDLTQQEITQLLDLADRICADPAAYQEVANHKKLATLFYVHTKAIAAHAGIYRIKCAICCFLLYPNMCGPTTPFSSG